MADPFGPMRQSRNARVTGEKRNLQQARERANRSGTYEGLSLVVRRQRDFAFGDRSAHFDTLFGNYTDVIRDPSAARQRDSNVSNRMRQDLQVLGCLNVRKLATTQRAREWVAKKDTPEHRQVAAMFETAFNKQYRLGESLNTMLDAILDGISIHEMVWKVDRTNFTRYLHEMFPMDKDRFVFSKDGQLCMLTRGSVYYGEAVHPWQFIKHVYNPRGGSWSRPNEEGRVYWGHGLEDSIYPNYFFKTVVLNLYTRWLQRLSGGVLVARYPERNSVGRALAMELLEAYQVDQELAYPSGEEWNVEIKEATRAPADTYLAFIEYCDRQMSKAILGSTLIIDQGDVGSQSLGEVHERTTFGRIVEFDRQGLEETFKSELIPIMGKLNHVPEELWPDFRFSADSMRPAAQQILEAFSLMQSMGYDVSAEMISESTGFRTPRPGETLLQLPTPEGMAGDMGQVDGEGAPLSGMDLSTPEGMAKFRAIVYRTSHRHERGRQKYELAVAGLGQPHRHSVQLDKYGNGCTDKGQDGHQHEVRAWRCQSTSRHVHEILLPNGELEAVARMLAA